MFSFENDPNIEVVPNAYNFSEIPVTYGIMMVPSE
jgi:hypothetical protein